METPAEIPIDKEAWHKKRRKMKRTLLLVVMLLPALSTANLWRDEQDYQHLHQQAVQYQQDCAEPTAASQNCQLLPMQVYEHTSKVSLAPDDSESDLWLGLQGKSGQMFTAQIYNPQWDQIKVGDSVTATVWKGKVENIRGGGMTKETQANPAMRAEGARSGVTISWVMLGISAGVVTLLFLSVNRTHKNLWADEPGNNTE